MGHEEAYHLERLIDSLGAACLVLSEDGRIVTLNRKAEELYGVERTEVADRDVTELCAESDRCLVECALAGCSGSTTELTARQRRSDGSHFLGELTATRHSLEDPSRDLLVVVVRELAEGLETCREDLEMQQMMLEHSLDGIVAHTLEGELLYANVAALRMWDMSIEEVRARGPWGWVSEEVREMITHRIAQLIETGQARFESHRTMDDGKEMHQEIHARVVNGTQGRIVIAAVRDISERVQAEEMVRHLAYHDMLTGLANRALLDQELSQAVATAERHGDLVGVVFIDLDDFKPINDTYGHVVGDQVLREVAHRLTASVREYDTVARMGGDEFVVVLPRLPRPETLMIVAHKLLDEIARPISLSSAQIRVSASAGLALRRQGEDAAMLLTRADLDMYEVRERKREAAELSRPERSRTG